VTDFLTAGRKRKRGGTKAEEKKKLSQLPNPSSAKGK